MYYLSVSLCPQDNMRPLWKSYLRSADGILLMVDAATRRASGSLVKTQNPPNISIKLMSGVFCCCKLFRDLLQTLRH